MLISWNNLIYFHLISLECCAWISLSTVSIHIRMNVIMKIVLKLSKNSKAFIHENAHPYFNHIEWLVFYNLEAHADEALLSIKKTFLVPNFIFSTLSFKMPWILWNFSSSWPTCGTKPFNRVILSCLFVDLMRNEMAIKQINSHKNTNYANWFSAAGKMCDENGVNGTSRTRKEKHSRSM